MCTNVIFLKSPSIRPGRLHPCVEGGRVERFLLSYWYFVQFSGAERLRAYRDRVNKEGCGRRESSVYCSGCAFSTDSTLGEHR